MLKDYGTWPAAGGWVEQTAVFLNAVDLCDKVALLYGDRESDSKKQEQRVKDMAREMMERANG